MLNLQVAPILPLDSQSDPAHLEEVAQTKRFLEWWTADPAFRAALDRDPLQATREAGLQADPLAIRQLWDRDPNSRVHRQEPTPTVARYRAFMAEKVAYRTHLRQSAVSRHPGFEAWRERQIRRCFGELGPQKGDALVHSCLAAELCVGCSVGCWFCGISALKLGGTWPYEAENAQLWHGCLEALGDLIGEAAGRGFCYWATDPLDNPDYERFCSDFADRLGRFPQTTTAQPLRDPARFRRLHQLSRQRGNEIDRFSVLSLGILKKIFAEYTARELLFVEMVMQMDGAWGSKAYAGRARSKPEKWRKSTGQEPQDPETSSTIACVSGVLLRMPERSFELIAPCRADERWPNGYWVLARRSFSSAAEFSSQLAQLLEEMPVRVPLDRPLKLRRDLTLTLRPDGFEATTHYLRHEFLDQPYRAMRELGEGLAQGCHSAMELALRVESRSSLPETLAVLNQFYSSALLDEEPTPP